MDWQIFDAQPSNQFRCVPFCVDHGFIRLDQSGSRECRIVGDESEAVLFGPFVSAIL